MVLNRNPIAGILSQSDTGVSDVARLISKLISRYLAYVVLGAISTLVNHTSE